MIQGFKIPRAAELHDELVEYAEKGALRGDYLGFTKLHKNYTMAYPGVTDWTGFPSSGKTQLVLELLYISSLFYGRKHFLHCPDIGTAKEIVSDLVHIHTGRTFDRRFGNHIDEAAIAQATPWILEHFIILEKEDPKAKISPYKFYDCLVQAKKEYGVTAGLIDSWKDMDHSEERKIGRTDQYLEDVLSYRNHIAEYNKLHIHQIIHPIKTDKDTTGKRKPPGPYDLKGGSEWYNNGKVIATVHRPHGSTNEVEVIFHKIKPRSIGSPGKTILYFDRKLMRYYEEDSDGTKLYADKEKRKLKSKQTQEAAAPKSVQGSLELPGDEDPDDVPF